MLAPDLPSLLKIALYAAPMMGLLGALYRMQKRLARTRQELAKAQRTVLEAERLKTEFLTRMSHEVRTPLNAIIGMSELLSDTVLSGEQREYAEGIRQGGEDLLKLAKGAFEQAETPQGLEPSLRSDEKDATALEARSISDCTVLLVEDNAVNQALTRRHVEKFGCRCKAVKSGREAVEAAACQDYDLILMDCQMPDMDGYQATAEIRRRGKSDRDTPIVAVTAHALRGDRERCLAAGMNDYLSKPFKSADLRTILARWLKKPADAGASPIDLAILRDATNDDAEAMRYLADIYLENTRATMGKIAAAVDAQNAGALELAAHGCAGSSASFGATGLSRILHELEAMGREQKLAAAPGKLEEARREYARVVSCLEKILPQAVA